MPTLQPETEVTGDLVSFGWIFSHVKGVGMIQKEAFYGHVSSRSPAGTQKPVERFQRGRSWRDRQPLDKVGQ